MEAKAQGTASLASNPGTRGAVSSTRFCWRNGMIVGTSDVVRRILEHPVAGSDFPIDNQWKDVHGKCPTLHPLGVTGTFWIKAATMDRICETGEVYAHKPAVSN